MDNREFINSLLGLMNEHPNLSVMCMVDSDIVAEDGYAWWLGKLDTNSAPEIRKYSTNITDSICFKDDKDYSYWFEELNLGSKYDARNVSDSDWDKFAEECVNKEVMWHEAIFVKISI